MTAVAKAARTIVFDARVRILDMGGRCVRTIPVEGLSARVPSGQASAQVDGCLYADGLEVPFSVPLPTQRGRITVDLNWQPAGQVVKQVSRSEVVGGSGAVVRKMTATATSPVPNTLEVWVQGENQFWTKIGPR